MRLINNGITEGLLIDFIDKDFVYEDQKLIDTNLNDPTMTFCLLRSLSGIDFKTFKRFRIINAYLFSNFFEPFTPYLYILFPNDVVANESILAVKLSIETKKLIRTYKLNNILILRYDVSEYIDDILKMLDGKYSKIDNELKNMIIRNSVSLPLHGLPTPIMFNSGVLYPTAEHRERLARILNVNYPTVLSKDSEVFSKRTREEETLVIKEEYLPLIEVL